jgi:hypothetical protein
MTDKEKYDFLKKAHPKATDAELRAAVKEFQVLESGLTGSQITKALLQFGKSVFSKKAAQEGVKVAGKKKLTKKNIAIGAGLLYAGQAAVNSFANRGNADTGAENASIAQAQSEMANAITQADAAGIDVTTLGNSPLAQQLGLNANNLSAFANTVGLDSTNLVGLGNVGVYTGKTIKGGAYQGSTFVQEEKPEVISLNAWKQQFPSTLREIEALKNQMGLPAGAQIDDIKSAWEKYGKLSLDYKRAGTNVSPQDLMKINRGLSGNGNGPQVTIDTSPIAETDIKTLGKRQLQASLGLTDMDDKTYQDILKIVRKNEAKRPTKTVRTTVGNTTKVKTEAGYGQADVLADVEAYAKKDPRYADFQTSDVFGAGMIRALGLKA